MEDYTDFLKTTEKTELEIIREIVEKAFDVDLSSRNRQRFVVDKRIIYSKIARERTVFSVQMIGREIKRDHATILNHLGQADSLIRYDEKFKKDYFHCLEKIPVFDNYCDVTTQTLKRLIKTTRAQEYKLRKELTRREKL